MILPGIFTILKSCARLDVYFSTITYLENILIINYE